MEFPCHACAHCKGFATAAPRRARTLFSVSFSRLGLSSPLQILGLVVLYTANCLICRQLILRRRNFQRQAFPGSVFYGELPSLSRGCAPPWVRLLTCYGALRHSLRNRLACLSRTPLAALSRRIDGNYIPQIFRFAFLNVLASYCPVYRVKTQYQNSINFGGCILNIIFGLHRL